jgi:Abortive infection alpha
VGERENESAPGLAERERPGTLEAAPGLARIGAEVWWRTARWSLANSLRIGGRLLGLVDSEGRVAGAVSDLLADRRDAARPPSLRERGEDLLRASADVRYEQGTHPAYERILADLAPDEARILRLLAQEGPQPSIDVRAGLAFVPGSRLVMQGYSMIGAEAGCRFPDQVPAYLSNLHRLGLIWFSRDPVRDRERYQVIEVQPEVIEALREAGRFSHVVRRSIHLTPLGRNFCEVALPIETAEFEALDQHEFPDEG